MNPHHEEYDVIIVGAGPAGLASAIFCARKDLSVLLLEKGSKIGPEPRGETLHDDPILSDILGEGFMDSISLNNTASRLFHAPDVSQTISKKRKTPSIVFNWDLFIGGFAKKIRELNVDLKLNSEVTELILNGQIICGVVYQNNGGDKNQAFAKAILACDGHQSIIGKKVKIPYQKINFPIMKSLMKNGNIESKGFQYFFVPQGELDYAPDFPPIIAFVFPRDEKNLECGIMVQTDLIEPLNLPKIATEDITKVWVKFKDEYPLFSDIVRNCPILYEKLTALPMTGPIDEIIPRKGLIMIGDSAGFVEVSGGSGLVTSIKMARFWVNEISAIIGTSNSIKDVWTDSNVATWEKSFKKTSIYKHVKKTARRYNWFRKLIFAKWGTSERIMKKWWIIKLLMMFT